MTRPEAASRLRYAVVVVNFASSTLLERNAAALVLPAGGRLVIVDCFSDAAERERVRRLAIAHGWEAVLLEQNAGFGGGVNAGAARALELESRVLIALNPDAKIDGPSLETLIDAVDDDPLLLASPTILDSSGRSWFEGADLYFDDGAVRGTRERDRFPGASRREWATGACFAISSELWRKLGGFDEEYFLYWEDIDLSHRALDLGGRLAQVDATATHDVGGTQRSVAAGRAKSETYYYYNIRNRMLYALKHLDGHAAKRWSRSAAKTGMDVLMRGGRRQLLVSLSPWRAYFRALRDGRRILRAGRTARASLDASR